MAVLYNRIRRVRGKEAKIFGVLGGISKHLNPEADPFILRSLFVVLAIFSGGVFMLIAYLIAAAVLQVEPLEIEEAEEVK